MAKLDQRKVDSNFKFIMKDDSSRKTHATVTLDTLVAALQMPISDNISLSKHCLKKFMQYLIH